MSVDTLTLVERGVAALFRLGMRYREIRKLEDAVAYLEALGPAPRSDVAGIEAEARERLRGTTESD